MCNPLIIAHRSSLIYKRLTDEYHGYVLASWLLPLSKLVHSLHHAKLCVELTVEVWVAFVRLVHVGLLWHHNHSTLQRRATAPDFLVPLRGSWLGW